MSDSTDVVSVERVIAAPADRLLGESERIELAGISFFVSEIPGHSPGSVVFIADGEMPPFVLAGDVLFSGSVGRTDFPGGSAAALFSGISFLAAPSEGYANGLTFYLSNFGFFVATPITTLLFLPFFYRARFFTAYQYLEGESGSRRDGKRGGAGPSGRA